MTGAAVRARFDWLVELFGAASLGLGAAIAALKAAPTMGWPGPQAMVAAAGAGLVLGMAAMRWVKPPARSHALREFTVVALEPEEPLLLDRRYEEPLLLTEIWRDEPPVLLLEDLLTEPAPDARVVRLFDPAAMPTAGQIKQRIDRYLVDAPARHSPPMPSPPYQAADASAALFAALDELKRSLR